MPTRSRSRSRRRSKPRAHSRSRHTQGGSTHYTVRKAYTRHAHTRAPYVRKSGTHVRAAKVHATRVPATRKKGLIPLKDYRHLGEFGYHLDRSSSTRHTALRKAADKYGTTWAIRRLNALANIRPKTQKYAPIVAKMRRDIDYIHQHIPRKYVRE